MSCKHALGDNDTCDGCVEKLEKENASLRTLLAKERD